jgi:tetratricopeptide (TPR) repeat protein
VAGGGYTLGSYQPEPLAISGGSAYTRAKALLAVNRSDERRQAIPLFRQAIAQNPDNAEAYLGLAEAKMELLGEHISDHEHYTEVHALLARALGLNPQLARAHMWMGVLLMRHDHDLRGAEERFKASLAISPNDDLSHFLYEQLLLIEKRFDEAREQIALARANNPLSYPYTYLVWVYLLEKITTWRHASWTV